MWFYQDKEFNLEYNELKKYVGFVYLIERLNIDDDDISPIFYIGKKNFFKKTKSANKESNWRDYYSSSELLQNDVKKYGKENFKRTILYLCKSKSSMTYYEINEQFKRDVLRIDKYNKMSKKYYNLNISGKFYKSNDFSSQEIEDISTYLSKSIINYDKICVTNGTDNRFIKSNIDNVKEWLKDNSEWYVGSSNIGMRDFTVVNNGIETKHVRNDELDTFLSQNDDFVIGRLNSNTKDMICVTNGIINKLILDKNLHSFLSENDDFVVGSKTAINSTFVNNNEKLKLISNNELELFLLNNKDYKIGIMQNKKIIIEHEEHLTSMKIDSDDFDFYKEHGWVEINTSNSSHMMRWVNKNGIDKKIYKYELNEYLADNWKLGRYKSHNLNKICIYDENNNIKYIHEEQLNEYLSLGWKLGGITRDMSNKIYICNDKLMKTRLIDKQHAEIFINENDGWRIGQLKRANFNTNDKVFAYNMETNEKITITKKEYNDNPHLYTSIKTKKIKVKKNNRIIFKGFITKFFQDFDLPELPFRNTLRKGSGDVIIQKGKYEWLNEEKYHIVYL